MTAHNTPGRPGPEPTLSAEYVAPLDEGWLAEEWTYLIGREAGVPWREVSSGIVTNAVLRTLRYLGYDVVQRHSDGRIAGPDPHTTTP